jgi:Asp/Glu/hydantoin racemase
MCNSSQLKYSLALIHTVSNLASTFTELVGEHLPCWEPFNIVDESLLKNTIREGSLSVYTMRRLAGHVWSAEDAGADAILVTCSSIGPAVDAARAFCGVPLVRVDVGMVEKALQYGGRVGVLATLSTTLAPTANLVTARAGMHGVEVAIESYVCEGAFESLTRGDRDAHDTSVCDGFLALADKVDTVILAQASMANVLDEDVRQRAATPVLSSPELGVQYLRSVLSGEVSEPADAM